MDEETKELARKNAVSVATNFVRLILGGSPDSMTAEGIYELYLINSGDTETLLEHLKAVSSIVNEAIKQLEGDSNGWCSC